MTWQLSAPESEAQWQAYYNLRYQVLRAPWGQARGSERDELEAEAFHQMLTSETGEVLAVGRLHRLHDGRAQVRYMAVSPDAQGKGFGAIVLKALEQQAEHWGATAIVLNARENALGFYRKLGYLPGAELPPLYGIAHQQMSRPLALRISASQSELWCQQLAQTWQQTIPLSAYMQLKIDAFDQRSLVCSAPLAPNKNLHQSMFAGAIYSLLTLTGWGMIWLQLQAEGLEGDIVLADADMRYLAPVRADAVAKVRLLDCRGSLQGLAQGRRVRQQVLVQLWHEQRLLAEFNGRFAVLPHA
jgi:thioesterase domain-containing protein